MIIKMPDIIKCKDCKYLQRWRTPEQAEKFGQIYECEKLILSCPEPDDYCSKAKIKEEKSGKWIPVSERLPKKSGKYWCTFGGTNLTGSDYYTTESDAKKLFDDPEEYAGWRSQNVIAWMPLPEPYKVESEE